MAPPLALRPVGLPGTDHHLLATLSPQQHELGALLLRECARVWDPLGEKRLGPGKHVPGRKTYSYGVNHEVVKDRRRPNGW